MNLSGLTSFLSSLTLQDVAQLTSAVGVGIAADQLRRSQRQALTAFEDSMSKEYRELAAQIPTEAFFGQDLDLTTHKEKRDEFYRYFDLCNEQVFLRHINRVSRRTWIFWWEGIHSNLRRPAFKTAWEMISGRASDDFSKLRVLLDSEEKNPDPRKGKCWKLLVLQRKAAAKTA